ncbi:non-homologous end joining protein Ku [Actinacidiphila yeochonensis]|uniref:non-homologous end joining protein Ku n=1 Tax=Actinacidiphila yeochonensis TaxID=89050 RepID=UPI00055CF6A9|nr:Ku protein [Actinacidiphila yeochonensis]
MRSVWTGNLAFGLVSIPVKLGSAVSSHRIGFRQIHREDQGRVRYQKTCELDGEVLETAEIGRAYETPDERLVEVSDADLKALPLPTAKTIEVTGFVDVGSVDAMQLATPYFLAPASPTAHKPYVLMRQALAESGKAAVGKFAMRNAEHLALVRARGDVLLLHTLRWPDELNAPADSAPKGRVAISDSELKLADTLIDTLGEADLASYHDEYAQAVEALVAAKLEGAEPPAAAEEPGGQVVDLMSALRASVEKARPAEDGSRRGGPAAGGRGGAGRTAGRAAPGKPRKTTAKKAAARKKPAKEPARKAAPRRKAG